MGSLKTGLSLRINAVFVLGAVILLAVKFIQDGGILRSANTTKILGISAMIPLLLIGIVPILTGDIVKANFFPLAPLAHDALGRVTDGTWNMAGITVFAGGHVSRRLVDLRLRDRGVLHRGIQESEDRHLQGDFLFRIAVRGGLHPGAVCVPGLSGLGQLLHPAVLDAAGTVTTPAEYGGMLAPDIYSGMGVAAVMARMVHAGQFVGVIVVVMLILALVLSLMTSMAGSSRTLYQASLDGWLPKYLAKVNSPRRADQRHAHQFGLQPGAAAAVRFGVRHRRRQHRLSDLQFPEFERRLDSSHGPPAPGATVARADLDSRRRRGACAS